MAAELIDLLARSTLVSSAAIIALLLLRTPLGRLAGFRVVYASWWLVPVALTSLALPGPRVQVEATQVAAGEALESAVVDTFWVEVSALGGGADASAFLMLVWLVGCALSACIFLRQQRRFRRRVGRLSARADGNFTSATRLHGPVVIGLLWPRIIVPLDFDQRYDVDERALILAHEAVHLRRGDLLANFALTALRCLYWFNPLLPFAAARFRADQELACDAAVVARFPESRRRYADAMLKTQLADLGLPVGCAWQSSHPMRERIAMLKNPLPGALRTVIGAAAVVAMSFGCAAAVWAAQPLQIEQIEAPADSGSVEQRDAAAAESSQYDSATGIAPESLVPAPMQRSANQQGRAATSAWWLQIPGAAPAPAAYMTEPNQVDC
jgi:beta-lactamase regulating signal transducer with metallopeptidase domain